MLREYSEITDDQIEFLKGYMHPWSIILKKNQSMVLPKYLDADQYSHISFRVATVCLRHREDAPLRSIGSTLGV